MTRALLAWITAHPIASGFMAALGLLAARWGLEELWAAITVTDSQEYGPVEDGAALVDISEYQDRRGFKGSLTGVAPVGSTKKTVHKPYPGDGVEAGV